MEKATEILIADDDLKIRKYLFKILTRICMDEGANVEIIGAENGEQAIAIINQKRDEIGLVFTDVVMPTIDGNHIARNAFSAGIPVIITTAHLDKVDKDVAPHCQSIIEKPFGLAELRHALLPLFL